MSLLDRIIRPDVRALTAYHVPDAADVIKLDAMENPFPLPEDVRAGLAQRLTEVAVNRYPVPTYSALKRRLCETQGVPAGYDLMLGNGSDELIAILSVACAVPGSKVLAPVPGFVMYERSALFAGMEFVGVPLRPDFTLDRDAMLAAMRRHRPAITYLAYPNNPTGTLFPAEDIAELVREADGWGIVVVDEAYQPFAQQTFLPRLPEFPNLVVMRTVSKLGLAGLRLGYLSAAGELLAEFEKVRPPYNVNVLTEAAADYLLERADVLEAQAAVLRSERSVVAAALAAMPELEVFPSAANFLLVRLRAPAPSSDEVCARLLKRKILIKNAGKMHPLLENCLRITIGTPQENRQFLDALKASLAL